jgi:hypothetical protein
MGTLDAALAPDLHVGRVDPKIRPLTLDGTVEERTHPLVDLLAEPRDLALRHARAAHGLHEVIDRAGRDTLDVGLLDHSGERLLGHPARLQEAGEVRALAQLRDAQFDRAGPRLPVSVTVAVALDQSLGALLAVGRAGQAAHLQLHQSLGCKTDHLA